MCIIAIKPAGKEMFPEEIIENMFWHNSDGAGLMYPESGAVHIRKGFMDLKSFKKAIAAIPDAKNKTVVLHCRIATAGGVNKQMCHPFPLSDKDERLCATEVMSPVGIAHNGVLSNKPRKGFSDTADYIKYQLYPHTQMVKNWRTNKMMHDLIGYETEGSKLAILLNNGQVIRTGKWEEEDGYLYSNTSYESFRYTKSLSRIYDYGWDDWDDWGAWDDYGSGTGYSAAYEKLYDADCCLRDQNGQFYEILADEYVIDVYGEVYMKLYDPDFKEYDYYITDLTVCDSTTLRELSYDEILSRNKFKKNTMFAKGVKVNA